MSPCVVCASDSLVAFGQMKSQKRIPVSKPQSFFHLCDRPLRITADDAADYLRDVHRESAEANLCDYGIQLTRSFRALKVWLSMQTFGLKAFRDAITRLHDRVVRT